MDGNIGIGFETQAHLPPANLEHRDFEHALEAVRAADHYDFLGFPRQDQHGKTSVAMAGCLVHSRSQSLRVEAAEKLRDRLSSRRRLV
jgi:hypothetical protein